MAYQDHQGYQNAALGAQQVRDTTELEQLLHRLYSLRDSVSNAANRSLLLADRILGSEPSPLRGGTEGKATNEPPLIHRLSQAVEDIGQISEIINQHLTRLERL
jgi:hypothetical protein